MSEQLKGLVEKINALYAKARIRGAEVDRFVTEITFHDQFGNPYTENFDRAEIYPPIRDCLVALINDWPTIATALQSLMEEKERLEEREIALTDRLCELERAAKKLSESSAAWAIEAERSVVRLSHAEAVVRELVRLKNMKEGLDGVDMIVWSAADSLLLEGYERDKEPAWQSACTFLAEQDKQPGDSASADVGGVPTRRLLPAMHNPSHEEPFTVFVQAMADELRANAHKGDRAGWLTMNRKEAVAEVLYHAAKLSYAVAHDDDEILEFAADVANCALMVADICDALASSQGTPQDVSPRDERISCHCFSDEARRLCLDKHRCYGPAVAAVSGESHE